MSFVVEVSNPRLANDAAYERWALRSEACLAEQLDEELGWGAGECQELAAEIAAGERFEAEDDETGRVVAAWRETAAVA